MKKLILILLIFFVILIFSCTFGGIELGLIGTWNVTGYESDTYGDADDASGTLVIKCDDTFTMNFEVEYSGVTTEIESSGTVIAELLTKIYILSFDEYKQNGTDVSNSTDSGTYSYTCNSLILSESGGDVITCTK